jgi:membrane-associated protease RseP (regulator of RpoE activity)
MRRILSRILIVSAVTFSVAPMGFSQLGGPCFACPGDGGGHCHGYVGSNCVDYGCTCAGPASSSAYSEVPQPGLLATRSLDELVVSGVLPGSPAGQAGILPGDHIVLIGGKKPTDPSLVCRAWTSDPSERSVELTLTRASHTWRAVVGLTPMQGLLEGLWIGANPHGTALPVALRRARRDAAERFGPYTAGMRWANHNGSLMVTEVMPGSPAQVGGISPYDRVLEVNGVAVSGKDEASFSWLLGADEPRTVVLMIEQHGARNRLQLTTAGVSEVVHRLASEPPAATGILLQIASIER